MASLFLCTFSTAARLLAPCLLAATLTSAHADDPLPPPNAAEPPMIAPYRPRFGRTRPVVAVVGENAGTELTDFVAPLGILRQAGVADVSALAPEPGPMQLRPALRILPDASLAQFDERMPDGADYVIVPAVATEKTDDPVLLAWLRAQAGKGATIVSICDGALVVAKAGLFKGHRATGHWATQSMRERDFPDTQWLKNTRYVADGHRISSAGVSAAIPLSIALVEAMGGHERAVQVAADLGVDGWSTRHDSERFHLGLANYVTAAGNWLSPRQDFALAVAPGGDEIALALTADALNRTYRSRVHSVAASLEPVRMRGGLTVLPDRVEPAGDAAASTRRIEWAGEPKSTRALDRTLDEIGAMYGERTADFVSLQLEYPRHPAR